MGFPHHGDRQNDAETKKLMERFTAQIEHRAKREYSQGRLNANDDGDLAVVISTDYQNKRIVLDFGKPVTWLGMNADDAMSLAQQIFDRAHQISDKPS